MDDEIVPTFEEIFGKEPPTGYLFRHIDFCFGIRSIVISWSAQGLGFGELALGFSEDGIFLDTEMMDNSFVIACIDESIRRIDSGQKASTSIKLNKTQQVFYETLEKAQSFLDDFLRQKDYPKNRKVKTKFFLEKIFSIQQACYNFLNNKEYYQFGGYKRTASKEENENTIKSILLFFKHELEKNPKLNQGQ